LLAFAALYILLAAVVYGLNVWSFNRSFSSYLQQQSLSRLQPLAHALSGYYAQQGSWHQLAAQPWELGRLAQQSLAWGRPPASAVHATLPHEESPPPPGMVLLDAARNPIVGAQGVRRDDTFLPVVSRGQTVGYLGLVPAPEFAEAVDNAFAHQQRSNFALIASVMLGISVLSAAFMGRWLGRPIRDVAHALHALSRGQTNVRVDTTRNDELGQLAQDLNRLAATLDANQQARQAWFMDIAHELRTPLTVLNGEIEAVEQGVRPADEHSMQSLRQEVQSLAALIDDLHVLSQADAGVLRYSFRLVDLASLVDELVARYVGALADRQIELRLELDSAYVWGDPERLRQLLSNLMQNTLRYTAAPGALTIRVTRRDERALLVWEDSAPGVDPTNLSRLGERFFQPTQPLETARAGTGIGLSIVRMIAHAHQMQVTALHSSLGGLRWDIEAELLGDYS
jgi:two-component system, OmpR family, sensor histidine kinase BaeS